MNVKRVIPLLMLVFASVVAGGCVIRNLHLVTIQTGGRTPVAELTATTSPADDPAFDAVMREMQR